MRHFYARMAEFFERALREVAVEGGGRYVPLQDQRPVGAAEAEGVGQGVLQVHRAGLVGDEIEVAPFARLVQVQGRRKDLVAAWRGPGCRVSRPPAAPRRWPVADLVEETASL